MAPDQAIQVPEGLTLITYQFLHGDILHLLSNMLFLWVFGDNVEDAMGHVKFLVVLSAVRHCGRLGARSSCCPTSGLPLIGASGAVAGVIAAYLILHPRVRVWVLAFRFIPLRIPAAWVLGVWVVTQLVMIAHGAVRPGRVVGARGRHGGRRRPGPVPAASGGSALRPRSSSACPAQPDNWCCAADPTACSFRPHAMLPIYCPKR